MDVDEQKGASDATAAAVALLDGDEASAETRWAEASDVTLDKEIEAYRRGIEDISKALEASGVQICPEEQDAVDGGANAEVEVRGFCSLSDVTEQSLKFI